MNWRRCAAGCWCSATVSIVAELAGPRLTVANIARECLGAEREVVAK